MKKIMSVIAASAVLSLFATQSMAANAAASVHYGKSGLSLLKSAAPDTTYIINCFSSTLIMNVSFNDGSSSSGSISPKSSARIDPPGVYEQPLVSVFLNGAPVYGPQYVGVGQNVYVGPCSPSKLGNH